MAKKKSPHAPSTMAELKATLWKAADRLRGSLSASQYKDVILGLVFLKYVNDAFDEQQQIVKDRLAAEGITDEEDLATLSVDPDLYEGSGVFLVPDEARWTFLAQHAKGLKGQDGEPDRTIGSLIDSAMERLMAFNPSLKDTLPRLYNRDNIDQRRLGELIDLFNSTRFSAQGEHRARDLMGEVYEYFLAEFARAEGKRGGEFFTPRSVVRTLVEVLEPYSGRVYDPCCGSGGMFVQSEEFIADRGGDPQSINIFGQESNEETWRMAKMNLAIHQMSNKGLGARWGDTFARDIHADVKMDFVMANPPFNLKEWVRREDDPRWAYGVPPARNANYAWIQHIISKLNDSGKAAVVMANGSMSSNSGGEGDIRAQIVEADLVSCMLALPTQLFRSTGIPVCVWFFAKDKGSRKGQTLFIDARDMGHMISRAERDLSPEDIKLISGTFHRWMGTSDDDAEYEDVPGFCKSTTLADIQAAGYALTPGRYVGAPPAPEDLEPIDQKIARLKKELAEAFDESARLERVVREQLGRLG
ncbi:type I restriction-modification system subunit M [Brevibacterium sp. 91QC2O2]|uniref:class I SAM-dependent DNA methyltransferase n=1 Tax=Brevibacterium TaxID=1696 RepID=UPI00211BB43C|nr:MULTISPECIES: type I restriction-modification system subunit M [unclassified Brevibacterium]MCQ9367137.1 type I restriction-modification system subunit M [Brevibacterium sp. 91QC2O2]MCQ9385416.1 type I restriction-modification system subunit M [Brevibacterium sp. 68QC2CO]